MTGPVTIEHLFDGDWYMRSYPDAAQWEEGPLDHFLRIGRRLGRAPGPAFDPAAYLQINTDVAEAGVDPLDHYLDYGHAEGRQTTGWEPTAAARAKVRELKPELYMLGRRDAVPSLWEEMALSDPDPAVRAAAAYELALLNLRSLPGTDASDQAARRWLDRALFMPAPQARRRQQIAMSMLCDWRLGARPPSDRLVDFWRDRDLLHEDGLFARGNLATSLSDRISWINAALERTGIPPVEIGDGPTPYDALRMRGPVSPVDGPKVSVIIAAWRCADTLPTALRSLGEQSWRNLEILVIDDASGDETPQVAHQWAARDPRIRVFVQQENGGAYIARNRALSEATGEFVTLHDADDWAHPERIERQVRLLLDSPTTPACLSRQVRMSTDLCVNRMTGSGIFLIENTSSLLFRRAPVVEALGAWDTTRFAADNEFIRRIRHVFGPGSVSLMGIGPLAFQRNTEGSAVSDSHTGIAGFPYGVRREYRIAQSEFLKTATLEQLRYDGKTRPYPVPGIMFGDRDERAFRTILGCDLRDDTSLVRLLNAAPKADAVFELPRAGRYDLGHHPSETSRRLITKHGLRTLVYGEAATARQLILDESALDVPYPAYMPTIRARRVRVISRSDSENKNGNTHLLPNTSSSTWQENLACVAQVIEQSFGTRPEPFASPSLKRVIRRVARRLSFGA